MLRCSFQYEAVIEQREGEVEEDEEGVEETVLKNIRNIKNILTKRGSKRLIHSFL